MILWLGGGGEKGRQVRREMGGDGGGGRAAESERWSAGSGSVSASASATAGSSSSACHVGSKALCVSVCVFFCNYYFRFACVCVFKGCGVHSYKCVTQWWVR